ncbi:Uncharacterised protein [Mycobacteroides abscessus subsp. abscessus]|nr:Uncharacterised protein [Mycobacteroides abscessus subsp. abscessus]
MRCQPLHFGVHHIGDLKSHSRGMAGDQHGRTDRICLVPGMPDDIPRFGERLKYRQSGRGIDTDGLGDFGHRQRQSRASRQMIEDLRRTHDGRRGLGHLPPDPTAWLLIFRRI